MRSELYQTLYKVLVFCSIATCGLTIGGFCLLWHMVHNVYTSLQMGIAIVSSVFGLLLCVVLCAGCIHFKKKYQSAAKEEEKMRKEQNPEEPEK